VRPFLEAGRNGLDGVLADLGVSRFQLTTRSALFRFNVEGPLDMRMDQSHGMTAKS